MLAQLKIAQDQAAATKIAAEAAKANADAAKASSEAAKSSSDIATQLNRPFVGAGVRVFKGIKNSTSQSSS